jgi:hypothetical protein
VDLEAQGRRQGSLAKVRLRIQIFALSSILKDLLHQKLSFLNRTFSSQTWLLMSWFSKPLNHDEI